MIRLTPLTLVILVIVALACNGTRTDVACTLEARAGINVTVVDSLSGREVAGSGIANEEAFADTLESFEPGQLFGVFERPGTYDVTVTAPGYRPWRVTGVTVRADECHVIPERLTARLQPS
ncbi:MAG: carboxypeptidase-like regulatory domain-containing protein [Gemmatimonadota bacterium]